MNFKKNWKRFFTVSRASEGFTLVELIVVIAILAILAGIAVPAYSGYIKKANKAADLQLLGAVNTAFAAACLENNEDPSDLNYSPRIIWGGSEGAKTVEGVTEFSEEFLRYYGDNRTATFKVIANLTFDRVNGVFAEGEFVEVTATVNGQTVTISVPAEDIAAFRQNTLYNELGVPGVTGRVDYVTGFANGLLTDPNSTMSSYIINDAQKAGLAASLGYDSYEEMVNDENSALYAMYDKIAEENPTITDSTVLTNMAQNQLLTNYAVLGAAQSASNISASSFTEVLTSGNAKDIIKTGDTGDVLTQAALAYGMYSSYAYSEYGNATAQANTNDPDKIMDCLEDEGFQAYMQTAQAQADLEGYLAALSMASSAAQSSTTTVNHALVNGYSDPQIQSLITSILNNQN